MTSPDGAGLPDPGSGWDGLGIPDLGSFLLEQMVVRPLAQFLASVTGRTPGEYEDLFGIIAEKNSIITGILDWVLGLIGLDGVRNEIADALEALANAVAGTPLIGGPLAGFVNSVADFVRATDSTATSAATTANTAQTNALSAQSTASTANTNANNAVSTANTAQTAASNAASVAAAAQSTADVAYANAQNQEKEFAVSTAAVLLGNNEQVLGVLMSIPDNGVALTRKITRLIYSLGSNNGTLTVQLVKRTLAGVESVVHTTNIPSSAITYADNTIDYTTADLDHYKCNVTAVSGVATALHCCIESVLLEV